MYKVNHSEKYLPEESNAEYKSLDEMKERYNVYWKYIELELKSLKKGEKVHVRYDDYINLDVEYV